MYSFLRMFITVILKPVCIFRHLTFARYTPDIFIHTAHCGVYECVLTCRLAVSFSKTTFFHCFKKLGSSDGTVLDVTLCRWMCFNVTQDLGAFIFKGQVIQERPEFAP